jgi:hypothetical protein
MTGVTPRAAIAWGLVLVNGPVLGIIIACGALAAWIVHPVGVLWSLVASVFGVSVGTSVAWAWWSFAIPRWRDWVEDSGLAPGDVQDLAVRVGLLWPVGSRFERTEFPRRDGRRGW